MKECARQYPPNWKEFSRDIRFERAAGRCECAGECGLHRTTGGPRRCVERDGQPAKWAKGTIVLTVAHLCRPKDHGGKKCAEPSHVKAMCQRCHLLTDQNVHMTHAAMTLTELEQQGLAVHFDAPGVGRFWIGAEKKAAGKQDPYFTTEEVHDWWKDGASVESFAAAAKLKRTFPGTRVSFQPGQPKETTEPASSSGTGDPVKTALEGWRGVKIE